MASNQRSPVVPTRVGRTPDGGIDPTVIAGGVLIRLPQVHKEDNSPGIVHRLSTLSRGVELASRLPLMPLAHVLKKMGATASVALMAHPKIIAGATLLLTCPLALTQMWRDKPPAVEEYPAPEVELAGALVTLPGVSPIPAIADGTPWTTATGEPTELQSAPSLYGPVAEIAGDRIAPVTPTTGAPPMPRNYDTATEVLAPQARNPEPIERMARIPNAYPTPSGPIAPPPAPSATLPTARFEGGIVPPAMGSQR